MIPCPFVRAVAEGRDDDARRLATEGDDPAEPVVVDWLIREARRYSAAYPEVTP